MNPPRLELVTLGPFPSVRPGDSVAELNASGFGETLPDGDVLVAAQEMVSKAQDRSDRSTRCPDGTGAAIGDLMERDARLVQLSLDEPSEIGRRPGVEVLASQRGVSDLY